MKRIHLQVVSKTKLAVGIRIYYCKYKNSYCKIIYVFIVFLIHYTIETYWF